MPNFREYSYRQNAMVVINFEDQFQPGIFELTTHRLIDGHIDLSPFYNKYSNDQGGRSAYGPAIILKIILFVYAKDIPPPTARSSGRRVYPQNCRDKQ